VGYKIGKRKNQGAHTVTRWRRGASSRKAAAACLVAAAVVLTDAFGVSDSRAAPRLDPSRFAELATGIGLVRATNCQTGAVAEGTGFLIGERVVMTARHIVAGACQLKVRIDGNWIAVDSEASWYRGQTNIQSVDVATVRLHTSATGYIFAIRTSSVAVGANLATLGHPLGNQLSITQGPVLAKGRISGVPMLAVRLLGAEGGSGSPLVDNAGNVAGILQQGRGSKDILGQRTTGVIVGIDLPSWWPRSKRDLCHAYPAGGIPSCPSSSSPVPPIPPSPVQPRVLNFSGTGPTDLAPFVLPVAETLCWTLDPPGDIAIVDNAKGVTTVNAKNTDVGCAAADLAAGRHQLSVDAEGVWTIAIAG
jgi:hypothetical protein